MMQSLKESAVESHRQYDLRFKKEAVQNWLNSGKSPAVVAEKAGWRADPSL